PIRGGEKLLDILVQGGSPVPNANLNNVTLTRLTQGGGRTTRKLNLKDLNKGSTATVATTDVMPGDVIYIPIAKPKVTLTERIRRIGRIRRIRSLNPQPSTLIRPPSVVRGLHTQPA